MLEVKEVRNPVKTVRAERILAALEANGPVSDYNAAGAISPEDGTAILRSKEAALAMTLAVGTTVGETLHLKCLGIGTPGVDTIVVTGTFTGGTTLTFAVKDEHAVLIWVGAAWTPRAGYTAALA
jgi:hypothetical protein